MKRRTKRTGTSLVLALLALSSLAEADKKKSVPEAYALVSGSVFHEPGLALPGAEVTLLPNPQHDGLPVKVKKLQTVTDARGEFVFRVPAATMNYTVRVSAKGYQPEEKSVSVQRDERAEITFLLRDTSK